MIKQVGESEYQLPVPLQSLLSNSRLIRAGVQVDRDIRRVQRDFNVDMTAVRFVNLETMAKDGGFTDREVTSLSHLSELMLGASLIKTRSIRCGDWSKANLSNEMKEYAAIDAKVSVDIYLKLLNSAPAVLPASDISLPSTRCGLDIWHFMDRLKLPKRHAYLSAFSKSFRDALLHANTEDKSRFQLTCKRSVLFGITKDSTFELTMLKNPTWVLKRMRRSIPGPEVLLPLLNTLLNTYTATDKDGNSKFLDPQNEQPLFSNKSIEAFRKLLPHVEKGCISDPVGIPLYYQTGVLLLFTLQEFAPSQICQPIAVYVELQILKVGCIKMYAYSIVYAQVIRKCGYWCSSPELMDAHLANCYEIYASQR
jgi:hypothetical protein